MTLREYCLKLLKECGCNQDCYKRSKTVDVMCDLAQYVREDNIRLPYLVYDVANMLIDLGNEIPDPPPAQWHMTWDTDSCCDGYDCESFGHAKNEALDTLLFWMTDDVPKSQEDWDYMIYNCGVRVYKRRDDIPDDIRTDKYDQNNTEWEGVWEEYWSPSQETLNEIGWMLYEDMPEEMQKQMDKFWKQCKEDNNNGQAAN